jgi:HEPN domain-containing protein
MVYTVVKQCIIGHLVIEKLLKAVFIKNVTSENPPPRTHDLLVLADRASIDTSETQKDWLDLITTFNISARYPDYKKSFYKKCTEQYTSENIIKIKELRVWLRSMLNLK